MHMACSKRLSQRFEEDMISELPDPLICHILNHLPTKDLVKTSALSTRWRSLWLWVPSLELELCSCPQDFGLLDDFVSFGDRFFDSDRDSCIQKLKLTIDIDEIDDDTSYLTSWIDAAVKRKVQHLDLHLRGEFQFFWEPIRFYNCETLVYLKIVGVHLAEAEFVYFPCVKFMHLEDNLYANEASFEKLVSSCPVLEELNIFIHDDEDERVFRVHSRSLKKITLVRAGYFKFLEPVPGFVIDAPLLCDLSINDSASESFIVNNLASKAKLDISLRFGWGDFDETKTSDIHSFFVGIRNVADMRLCENTFEVICQYLNFEQLPRFDYMSCLNLTLRLSDLKWLPTFLESCPNLKFLFLNWYYDNETMLSEEMNQISFSSVPQCLLSSLQFVDLRVRILGLTPEMKLIRYLLENSGVLQIFTIRLVNHSTTENSTLEELLRIPRGSTKCELAIF